MAILKENKIHGQKPEFGNQLHISYIKDMTKMAKKEELIFNQLLQLKQKLSIIGLLIIYVVNVAKNNLLIYLMILTTILMDFVLYVLIVMQNLRLQVVHYY